MAMLLTLVLLNPDMPALANSEAPDQLASVETGLNLYCLSLSM